MPSPFDVLELDPDADESAVHEAYRRRVKEAHPDQGGSAQEFQLVQTAYEAIVEGTPEEWYETDGSDENEGGDAPADPNTHVEFLDYEAVVDNGWSLDDPDLFETASRAGLGDETYGRFVVEPGEYLLESAENRGYEWPFSCRGGACANCAVAVLRGELEMTVDHVVPESLTERGIQLSCIGTPKTGELQVVYNVKHLPELEELQLPPRMD